MAIELTCKLALLCEGAADQAFFTKLIEKRVGIPQFDVLPAEGADKFGRLLRALTGDRHGFSRLEGLLIVADSGARPRNTLKAIQDQLTAAGGYPVPAKLSQVAPRTAGHPAVSITLLPNNKTAGALESLCVDEILARNPWAEDCLSEYLRCDKIEAYSWSAEKLAKAKYHCLVAALNKDDPSRALSMAFKEDRAIIDVTANCFNDIADRLRAFANALGSGTPQPGKPA